MQHFWGLKDGLYSTMTSPWLGIGSGFTQIAVVWIFEIFYRISRRHISPIQNGSSLFISCPNGFDSQKNKGRRKSGDSLLLKTVFKLCLLTPIRGTCTPLLVLLKTGYSNVYSMVRVRYYLFCEAVYLNDGYGKGEVSPVLVVLCKAVHHNGYGEGEDEHTREGAETSCNIYYIFWTA